jgi:hypothetical protein
MIPTLFIAWAVGLALLWAAYGVCRLLLWMGVPILVMCIVLILGSVLVVNPLVDFLNKVLPLK